MRSSIQHAIMKTIIYADIFDCPLKIEEIKKWLIESGITNQPVCAGGELRINNLKNIKEKDGYYFLKGRDKLVALRKEKEKYSLEKLKIVKKIAALLKLIPTIKLVGLTGALAVNNAKDDDDIDLFIITSRGLLWTTRFMVTVLVEISGRRRCPNAINVNNKICLNMFVDEDHLEIPHKEQDLFSAHEVVQMKLLWDKDETYKKFLRANEWVKKFLPNAIRNAIKTRSARWQSLTWIPPMVEELVKSFFNVLEKIFKNSQLWYMIKRRTTEVIKEGIIRFHPHDARIWILKKYRERIKRFR